jgi:hypothetical protein
LSRALVASSNNNNYGFLMKHLAMASLYFYPPDSIPPKFPTYVSIPSLIFSTNDSALAD